MSGYGLDSKEDTGMNWPDKPQLTASAFVLLGAAVVGCPGFVLMLLFPVPWDGDALMFFTGLGAVWGLCLWVDQEWPDVKAYLLWGMVGLSLLGWLWILISP